ncbi:MAG: 30S ribosomal protein S20 [Clostridia bacterium]|nr:30S ribosomal protein S20 [Clostridia bacterium]
MANIKSAAKRIKVIDRQTLENKSLKTKIATYVKKYKVAVDNGDKEASAKLLSETFSLIDSAVSKGTLQKATANRKKARLSLYSANK